MIFNDDNNNNNFYSCTSFGGVDALRPQVVSASIAGPCRRPFSSSSSWRFPYSSRRCRRRWAPTEIFLRPRSSEIPTGQRSESPIRDFENPTMTPIQSATGRNLEYMVFGNLLLLPFSNRARAKMSGVYLVSSLLA